MPSHQQRALFSGLVMLTYLPHRRLPWKMPFCQDARSLLGDRLEAVAERAIETFVGDSMRERLRRRVGSENSAFTCKLPDSLTAKKDDSG